MSIYFSQLGNPSPHQGSSVTWSVVGVPAGAAVTWSASPPIVSFHPSATTTANGEGVCAVEITPLALGFTRITAEYNHSSGSSSTTAWMGIGELLGWFTSGSALCGAFSNTWTFRNDLVNEDPQAVTYLAQTPLAWSATFGTFSLGIAALNAILAPDGTNPTTDVAFRVGAGEPFVESWPKHPVDAPVMIVAPDGTVWTPNGEYSPVQDPPPPIAPLAWAPPPAGGLPSNPAANVTCYVIDIPTLGSLLEGVDKETENVSFNVTVIP